MPARLMSGCQLCKVKTSDQAWFSNIELYYFHTELIGVYIYTCKQYIYIHIISQCVASTVHVKDSEALFV